MQNCPNSLITDTFSLVFSNLIERVTVDLWSISGQSILNSALYPQSYPRLLGVYAARYSLVAEHNSAELVRGLDIYRLALTLSERDITM